MFGKQREWNLATRIVPFGNIDQSANAIVDQILCLDVNWNLRPDTRSDGADQVQVVQNQLFFARSRRCWRRLRHTLILHNENLWVLLEIGG